MGAPDAHTWRIVRFGFGYLLFAAICLSLALVVIPAARWLGPRRGDGGERADRAQRAIHRGSRLFMGYMARAGLMTVSVEGGERLRRDDPVLLVANHPTLLDVVALASILPQVDCIVNVARARNPILRGVVRAAGYVRNDGGAAVVDACVERLRGGRSVLVFPEGTRSPAGGLHPFKRGAAHVALRSGCELLPIVLLCDPPALAKGQKWYDVPRRTIRLSIAVDEPIAPGPIAAHGDSAGLAARKLTAELRETFTKRMERG